MKEFVEKMRQEDRLLKESAVMKSVQKAIIEMGYEPFGEKQEMIYKAIENTPTASGWIPCSERLPVYLDNVLVCTENDGRTIAHIEHSPIEWVDMYMNKIDNVVAWQWLPNPYQKGAGE